MSNPIPFTCTVKRTDLNAFCVITNEVMSDGALLQGVCSIQDGSAVLKSKGGKGTITITPIRLNLGPQSWKQVSSMAIGETITLGG